MARVSSNGLNKIKSQKAIDKSLNNGFSKEEHIEAGKHLKELFENANLKSIDSDYRQRLDIKAIHRYVAKIDINDKPSQALLTLKESVENGHRIYSLELQELTPLSNAQAHTKQAQQGQSNLTKVVDAEAVSFTTTIEKTDAPNPTTNLQNNQAFKTINYEAKPQNLEEFLNDNTINPLDKFFLFYKLIKFNRFMERTKAKSKLKEAFLKDKGWVNSNFRDTSEAKHYKFLNEVELKTKEDIAKNFDYYYKLWEDNKEKYDFFKYILYGRS